MSQYLPIHAPGQALTFKASAAVTGGQVVAVTGPGTVAPAGADSTAWLGVAAFDAATNDDVNVFCGGTQECVASGSITAGAAVECGAAGSVILAATPTVATHVGIALTTAADGTKVRVRFNR